MEFLVGGNGYGKGTEPVAQRPVFVPHLDEALLVRTVSMTFEWFPGLSATQRQRSVESLHAAARQLDSAARQLDSIDRVLEVSTKSKEPLGVALSAFNLTLTDCNPPNRLSVECAFQGSKIFERGGPFKDIFGMSSREAKRDIRLKTSGPLVGFRFLNVDWPLEPRTAFYDWLYITALRQNPNLTESISDYNAFTDIEFNPATSINCQAYSVALYVSMRQRGLLGSSTLDKDSFHCLVQGRPVSDRRQNDSKQGVLL
jgi:hypothetical protein